MDIIEYCGMPATATTDPLCQASPLTNQRTKVFGLWPVESTLDHLHSQRTTHCCQIDSCTWWRKYSRSKIAVYAWELLFSLADCPITWSYEVPIQLPLC